MEIEKLRKLGIRNLHPVFGRGVRGETLARRGLLGNALECVRDAGVKVVVDFRTADHNDRIARRCADVGIVYHHIPTDAKVTPPEELAKTLPRLFEVLVGDGFYISCQQGLHRTDIALALYYHFHNDREVPEMIGHYKRGVFRCDDIGRRVNLMRPFFPEVDDETFLQRRKRFLAFNRKTAISHRDVAEVDVYTDKGENDLEKISIKAQEELAGLQSDKSVDVVTLLEALERIPDAAGCDKLNFGGIPGRTFMVATC